MQFQVVQTFFAQKASNYLNKEIKYKNTISIKSLYLKPFKSVVLEELLVLDEQKDTLLFMPKFMVNVNDFSLRERYLKLHTIQLNDGVFFLKDYKDRSSNLDVLINYFDSGPATPKDPKAKPFKIDFGRVILNDIRFRYINYRFNEPLGKHVNFENVSVTNLSGVFENINLKDHLIKANIKNLTLRERSGFYLKNLTALATFDDNQIEFENLLLVTDRSRLTDYYRMRFKSYRDFNSYVANVSMKANFINSHVSAYDVAFFAPELYGWKLDIDIDGQITGLINNLKAKKLTVKAGKSTYLKGDFEFKGLPSWKNTFMDLNFEMAATDREDLDEIIKGIMVSNKTQVPEIFQKFGNINFQGRFTGFESDFIAFADFKTKLGRFSSDVNMKFDKQNIASYTGSIKTFDFNIGELANEQLLGRVTSALNIKGKGFEFNNLKEELKGQINYIDFNNYRYNNLTVNGTLDQKFFNGQLKIDDENLNLDFDGSVNLQPNLPEFNFNATVNNAQLKALNLYSDSLRINANLSTNFTGQNLNNITGNLLIKDIELEKPNGVYKIDSIQLTSLGEGIDRRLSIQSDVLEANIKGEFDLNSIVSYYKAIARTYVPSYKTEIINYKNQIFTFFLKIKNFEPIAKIFIPGLAIPDGGFFNGNFDSQENVASLNGFIKNLDYKGVLINNIILDESTTERQLQVNLTSDRVQLNDSLFISDVNISNILRNDSLAFNIKLSNNDEENQLDLNGLVEFTKNPDTVAELNLLPSILKVNSEDWMIQEKVRIIFNNGVTKISNFDLTNGNQQIFVNGLISENEEDVLDVNFKNFNLTSINHLLKSSGFKLNGYLNGITNIYSVLKSPIVKNDITIDSLNINNIHLGKLTDHSNFSSTDQEINFLTRVINNDVENIFVNGKVDIDNDELDLDVNLVDGKISLFEPFLKDLVTNLKGEITTQLNVDGSLSSPKISGRAYFNKGQATVNYLKTTYVITDQVDVENSTIFLNNFKLTDLEGHEAIANGTVDISNIDDPDLNIDIDAINLMALNTTAKDNSMYYGRAYGTGLFKFFGPTSKIKIDIDAKTDKGTVFNLPLNSAEMVSDKDFINFITTDTTKTFKRVNNFDGVTLTFKLTIDPNTTANIYTTLGKLSGKGNAELNLNINSIGDFEMFGDYFIESGNFDFTAQEVINKKFDIRQGGTIRWTGNPTNAQINLKAIYPLRANVNELYRAANREVIINSSSQRINTEVEMGLNGLLLHPDIKLDINFPSQPAIKEDMQTYFSDINNLNLQAFSLLIRRSFSPGNSAQSIGDQLASSVQSTATELVFNQFNNVLSSLNLNFVDLNVKSLSEGSASIKLFNDRLIINAGIVDRNSLSDLTVINFARNNVGSEVEALFLFSKDGSFTGKLANKPPTQQSVFLNSGISATANVTSLGFIYTQQFDTFKEFIQKLTGVYKRNLRKSKQDQVPVANKNQNNSAILNTSPSTSNKKK